MTTVVDPSGTPAPFYNRSGTTIELITAGPTNTPFAPTPIVQYAGTTVVLVTSSSTNDGVELPAGADVGDLVEIHCVAGGYGLTVYRPSGDTLHGATNIQKNIPDSGSRVFRKVSTTDWRMVGA